MTTSKVLIPSEGERKNRVLIGNVKACVLVGKDIYRVLIGC